MWECLAKVKIPDPRTRKIGSKTLDAVFVGYALDSNAGRFLVINSEVSEITRNTIIEARDAVYFENVFPLRSSISSTPSVPLISSTSSGSVPTSVQEPRRSKRRRVDRNLGDDFVTFMIEDTPTTYQEVIASADSVFWK